MSTGDAGRSGRRPPAEAGDAPSPADPEGVPRTSGALFGAARFDPIRQERDEAYDSLQQRLSSWGKIHRKAVAPEPSGDEALDVSSPEEPAEREADAIADGVADDLHRGADQKPAARRSPAIGAALDGVGRKIFRAGEGGLPRNLTKGREIKSWLASNGFTKVRTTGSHEQWRGPNGGNVTVADDGDIAAGTLSSIRRQVLAAL